MGTVWEVALWEAGTGIDFILHIRKLKFKVKLLVHIHKAYKW